MVKVSSTRPKRVYTLYGSEDGILGVYSSREKVLRSAEDYVSQRGFRELTPYDSTGVAKSLKAGHPFTLRALDSDMGFAVIESHLVDQGY